MITKIKLTNFRSYDKLELNVPNKLVIIPGKNAIGKTTILESIYLTSTLKSYRTNSLSDLIKENKPFSKIEIDTTNNKFQIILSSNSRKCFIDNCLIKKSRDFIANLHTVFFSPEDLELITSSPSKRRQFLDIELSMLNKKYLDCLSKAKYFLKQRNEALKNNANKNIIDVLTSSLFNEEVLIIKSRLKFLNLLNEKINVIHKTICPNEFIKLKYKSLLDLNKDFKQYDSNYEKDKVLKTTTLGFHRDDFEIYLNDHLAYGYASEGQIRNIAISIKIALVMLYESYLNETPILLLDDVFSELDKERKMNLIKFLKDRPQTFITTTSLEEIPSSLLENAEIIDIVKEK